MNRHIKITAEVVLSFEQYGNEELDNIAKKQIQRYVKDILMDQLTYIPIYVEKDENGALIEDCTKRTIIKFI